tara:strand:+ start:6244 stop:8520 length:2277 start_codon:yes stop_codon:yes gene_type:complete
MTADEDMSMKELKEKAKIIAEGTGRSYESVLEDLLDDGVVNLSNEQKKDGSLVDQLKEAAELIATVQSISNQVSENTVLNGKENKTEVVVETTLEGDIIDRAIDSVQRKADNIKKILITLAPVFLLLTGGSLEAIGIIDIVGSDDDHEDDEYYVDYGGCTAPDADNYDPDANWDDGSCYWDDNNGGGGGPPGPPCNEDWRWENVNIRDSDMNGQGFNNDIEVDIDFEDWNDCNRLMSGAFILQVWNQDANSQYDSHEMNPEFRNDFHVRHTYQDLPEGDYTFSIAYHFEGSNWNGPSQMVTIEGDEKELDIQNHQISLVGDNELKVEFNLLVQGDFCCEDVQIEWEIGVDGYYDDGLRRVTSHSYDEKGYIQLEEYWPDMADANYHARIEVQWQNQMWDEETTDGITVDTEPETTCDAFIDNMQVSSEADTVDVMFYIGQNEDSFCENYDINIVLMPVDDNNGNEVNHEQSISGSSNYYSHTFNAIPEGDWQIEVTISSEDEELAHELSDWIYISEPEPETCDINLYAIQFANNDTHASVGYDLDCGYGDNPGGHNVSVQFSVVENGTYEPILDYRVTQHYISGYVEDVHYLTLGDFTEEDMTHYDFYWVALWGDDPSYLERSWRNVSFDHPDDEEPEPQSCDNLTITSNSLLLGVDSEDNLTLEWDLNHDGPDDSSCYKDIEIQITLYQNGSYYDVSDFQDNGVRLVYASGSIALDASDVELFGGLSAGTYEVLVKYRCLDTGDVSGDYFANSVTIS